MAFFSFVFLPPNLLWTEEPPQECNVQTSAQFFLHTQQVIMIKRLFSIPQMGGGVRFCLFCQSFEPRSHENVVKLGLFALKIYLYGSGYHILGKTRCLHVRLEKAGTFLWFLIITLFRYIHYHRGSFQLSRTFYHHGKPKKY